MEALDLTIGKGEEVIENVELKRKSNSFSAHFALKFVQKNSNSPISFPMRTV